MAPGGGRTDWGSHSIADIIAKVQTMDSAQAVADAAALESAAGSARTAANRLRSVFDGTEWVLKGASSTAGLTSAITVGADVASAADTASSAAAGLTGAGDTLRMANGTQLTLSALQTQITARPERTAAIKARVIALMNSQYSDPMSGTRIPAASSDDGASPRTGTGGSDGSGGSGGDSTTQGGIAPAATTTTTGASTTTSTSKTGTQPSNTARTDTGRRTTTTTGGQQQNSTRNGGDSTSTKGDRTPSATTGPTPAGTTPARLVKDKALSLTGNRSTESPRSPGASGTPRSPGGPTSTPIVPLQRVSIPGVSTVGAPTTAPPGASPSTSNRGSVPPYAPHAGRSRGSADGAHRAASYLTTTENGEQVVGSLPLVGPPVVGDWPRAEPEPTEK